MDPKSTQGSIFLAAIFLLLFLNVNVEKVMNCGRTEPVTGGSGVICRCWPMAVVTAVPGMYRGAHTSPGVQRGLGGRGVNCRVRTPAGNRVWGGQRGPPCRGQVATSCLRPACSWAGDSVHLLCAARRGLGTRSLELCAVTRSGLGDATSSLRPESPHCCISRPRRSLRVP